MNIKPLGERVLVRDEELAQKTASGIIIPQTAQEKTQIGIVEAVGSEVKLINVGDRILHDKYSGTTVKVEGTEYLILESKNVLAILA
ncbi:MAG: co-chaperone GroES [Sphaerochaetaceae bacterium]|jgi:chaperonin GroES|nr:co-chaperone GroES [Sphaerochaetaceae bacterium]